jgi:hypothetical protein
MGVLFPTKHQQRPEYRGIENRFQFQLSVTQSLRGQEDPLNAEMRGRESARLMACDWKDGQVGAQWPEFSCCSNPKRQPAFVITNPHAKLILVALWIVGR